MKIKDMTTKTSLEVADSDLLVIEDEENTKSITVEELKAFLNVSFETTVKKTINATIDNIITALEGCKFIVSELHSLAISAWIEDVSGDINIALKDVEEDRYLTIADLLSIVEYDEDGNAIKMFTVEAKVADAYATAVSYDILDYNTEYSSPVTRSIPVLANAGFIKAHFDGLTNNEIAGITYDDIRVTLPSSETDRYEFVTVEEEFSNDVPYIEPETPEDEEANPTPEVPEDEEVNPTPETPDENDNTEPENPSEPEETNPEPAPGDEDESGNEGSEEPDDTEESAGNNEPSGETQEPNNLSEDNDNESDTSEEESTETEQTT